MARKMKDDPIAVAHGENLTGLDWTSLKKLADKLVKQREAIASENQEAGNIVKTAEKEHGANSAAFKLLVKLSKMSEEGRGDFLRTLVPGLRELGLTPREDLVDLMETT